MKLSNTGQGHRFELFMVVFIPIAGLVLAALMYFTGAITPENRTHSGYLLSAPQPVDSFQWQNSRQKPFKAASLDSKWAVFVIAPASCGQTCKDQLYLTRQVHTALGRHNSRVNRFLVLPEQPQPQLEAFLGKQHPGLIALFGNKPELTKESEISVLVADPLGNVMLWYDQSHTGKQILKDIEKLLKASRIG